MTPKPIFDAIKKIFILFCYKLKTDILKFYYRNRVWFPNYFNINSCTHRPMLNPNTFFVCWRNVMSNRTKHNLRYANRKSLVFIKRWYGRMFRLWVFSWRSLYQHISFIILSLTTYNECGFELNCVYKYTRRLRCWTLRVLTPSWPAASRTPTLTHSFNREISLK